MKHRKDWGPGDHFVHQIFGVGNTPEEDRERLIASGISFALLVVVIIVLLWISGKVSDKTQAIHSTTQVVPQVQHEDQH